MKKQGKVKAIPVEVLIEGMQVYDGLNISTIKNVIDLERVNIYPNYDRHISQLKTLVVEYEEGGENCENKHLHYNPIPLTYHSCGFHKKKLPLKYSQWKSAINNGEVDSDKVVEFEIKGLEVVESDSHYAKILPQKKKLFRKF